MSKLHLKLLIINIISHFGAFAQEDISGIYQAKYSNKVKIENDKFYYFCPDYRTIGGSDRMDTLADCYYKRVNDEFIELNSSRTTEDIIFSMKIAQDSIVNIPADSILVKFKIPYQTRDLRIRISSRTSSFFWKEFIYSSKNQTIMIPKESTAFDFSIEPKRLAIRELDGQYYGRANFYSLLKYKIEKNINSIEIEIPMMNNSFFETYFVKGEYARIVGDTLTWKGDKFVKKKK
jgi:hypothetical protein